jgi:hypothetical protein
MAVFIMGDSQSYCDSGCVERLTRGGEGITLAKATEVQRLYRVEGSEDCWLLIERYNRDDMDTVKHEQGKRGRK